MQLSVILFLSLGMAFVYGQDTPTIPSNWMPTGKYWFSGYKGNNELINKFEKKTAYYKYKELVTGGVSRVVAAREVSGYYILSFDKEGSQNKKFCFEGKKANQALFYRNSGSISQTPTYTIDQCLATTELSSRKRFKALILMSFDKTLWSGMVPDGTYALALQFGLTVSPTACTDANAQATMSGGNTLTFTSTCIDKTQTQDYANPFRGAVYVVDTLDDSQLSIGTGSSTSGMAVLAIKPGSRYYFYIAKYSVVTTNGIARLECFFSLANQNDPTGYVLEEYIPQDVQASTAKFSCTSNECGTRVCQNGGSCVQAWREATCSCAPGYEGAFCQTNIDECVSGPCQNGGTCKDLVNSFECNCPTAYDGDTCELTNVCQSNPCKNSGVCSTVANGYVCQCIDPYTGTNCDIINVCDQLQPCKNGATCYINGDSDYYCECADGFSGDTCAEVEECGTAKCNGQGTCVGQGTDITCVCSPGYTGENCENSLGGTCEADSCMNDGECVVSGGSFYCKCISIYDGDRCEDFADWFIVALVLMIIIGIILIILLFVCCCYCCCGWRPGQTSNYRNFPSNSSSLTSVKQPSTIEFNLSQASPYYGIEVLK